MCVWINQTSSGYSSIDTYFWQKEMSLTGSDMWKSACTLCKIQLPFQTFYVFRQTLHRKRSET